MKSQLQNIISSNFHKTRNIIELYTGTTNPQYKQVIKEFAGKHINAYSYKIIRNMLTKQSSHETDIEYCVYERKAKIHNIQLISRMACYVNSKFKKVLLVAHTLNLPYPEGILNCMEMLMILMIKQKHKQLQRDVAFIIKGILNKIDKSSPMYSQIIEIACKCAWVCKQSINK